MHQPNNNGFLLLGRFNNGFIGLNGFLLLGRFNSGLNGLNGFLLLGRFNSGLNGLNGFLLLGRFNNGLKRMLLTVAEVSGLRSTKSDSISLPQVR